MKTDSKRYWTEIRRLKGGSKQVTSETVEGISGSKDIADPFAAEYDKLYSYVQSDPLDLLDVQKCIKFRIQNQCMKSECKNNFDDISIADVDKSITYLKKSKSDGTDKELDKESSKEFSKDIMLLFNSMITHGYTPNALFLSAMIPIIKNKHRNISSLDNYRAIALSNILGKLLNRIILNSQ